MRVVVDIPPELVEEIRSVVRTSGYEDPEEFLERALRTQLELETGEQETLLSFSDAIETGGGPRQERVPPEDGEAKPTETARESKFDTLEDLSLRDYDVVTVEPPAPNRIDSGPLWGQYNRIFPMKLAVRRLAIVLSDIDSDGVPYDQFRNETAKVARAYGLRLVEEDEAADRGRGEKFSAALPTGDKMERSLDRFKTHFVGQIDTSGNLTGALPNLKFVDINPNDGEFGLTSAGLEFAELENPLLDDDIGSDSSLSSDERRFYLDHVEAEHSAEYEAMKLVANAITEGIDRPDSLSERVGELSDEWSSAQASTIRSGLVGRMYELGLVSRKRVETRGIGYELTEHGESEFR